MEFATKEDANGSVDFYSAVIDEVNVSSVRSGWNIEVYPDQKFITDAILKNEMCIERLDGRIIAAAVVNHTVNVSVLELRDEGFTEDIKKIIQESHIPNDRIAIEITESKSDSDFMAIKGMIEELKGCGMKIYLDDFGTGYSNLERIMKLPFDLIKFDRSLVLACQTEQRSEEIVTRLAGMFSDLHYTVLYEGVEDEADEKRCKQMSASYLQGYKYSKPVPMEKLTEFFIKRA